MNRLASVAERGIPLAFGSDCMPLDPLAGIEFALRAPTASQRLGVGDAIRAYTLGGAWAAFEADQLGRIAPGYRADLTILDGSPWNVAPAVGDLEVVATIVDGMPVYQTL